MEVFTDRMVHLEAEQMTVPESLEILQPIELEISVGDRVLLYRY